LITVRENGFCPFLDEFTDGIPDGFRDGGELTGIHHLLKDPDLLLR
jgi:hypothetical protein